MRNVYIGIIGSGECPPELYDRVRQAGRHLAKLGAIVINGGHGGVMEAAARGVTEAGGICVGVLPGFDRHEGNQYQTCSIVTGMGSARNAIIVASSHAILAISGGFGTLSEIGLALKMGVPVVGVDTWCFETPLLTKNEQLDKDSIIRCCDTVEGASLAYEVGRRRARV